MKRTFGLLSLAASGAFALGLGVGGFGGVALPAGEMANNTWVGYGGGMEASSQLGVKLLLEVTPVLGLEAAGAYQPDFRFNHPEELYYNTRSTVPSIPMTFGAHLKYRSGSLAVYGGGGAGYYLSRVKFSDYVLGPNGTEIPWETTAAINAPGFYASAGVLMAFGKFALDVNPRYTFVLNEGEYDYTYEWGGGTQAQAGPGSSGSGSGTYYKPWNDSYFNVLVGVNYYFM